MQEISSFTIKINSDIEASSYNLCHLKIDLLSNTDVKNMFGAVCVDINISYSFCSIEITVKSVHKCQ